MPQFIDIKYIHFVVNAITAVRLQNSSRLVKLKFCAILFSLFYFPPPLNPWQSPLYFVYDLTTPGTLQKCGHTVSGLL